MSWQDYSLARAYLAEAKIGTRLREAQHIESAQASASRKAVERTR